MSECHLIFLKWPVNFVFLCFNLTLSVIETQDICRTPFLTAQSGYISTPRYPNNYRDNLTCLTQIRVDPSQNINLTVIDMDLDRNGTYGCNDWLDAYNQYRSVTLCGRRTNEKLTTLMTNSISVKFQSDGRPSNKKGFWIYYEGKYIFTSYHWYTFFAPSFTMFLIVSILLRMKNMHWIFQSDKFSCKCNKWRVLKFLKKHWVGQCMNELKCTGLH